jgi:cob(I)alamin adenosyltransferase
MRPEFSRRDRKRLPACYIRPLFHDLPLPPMGHRLSKITTRTGDKGETGLADGTRLPKDSARIAAMGEVDELNSCIGVLLAEAMPKDVQDALLAIQHDLFDLGGEIATPGHTSLTARQIERLEDQLYSWNRDLPPLKEFILPGGTRAAAVAHLARTVCRRAERALVTLAHGETVSESARVYLNRLSDLLFVLGRVLNRAGGQSDVLWQQGKNR